MVPGPISAFWKRLVFTDGTNFPYWRMKSSYRECVKIHSDYGYFEQFGCFRATFSLLL
jgi:hypothetical protein